MPRIYLFSAVRNTTKMKTIEEIRRENLNILIGEFPSAASFSEKIGKSPSQVSQWKNSSIDSKSGKPRNIDSETAREIEKALEKEKGWMDHDHSDIGLEQFKKLDPAIRAALMRQSNSDDEQKNNAKRIKK